MLCCCMYFLFTNATTTFPRMLLILIKLFAGLFAVPDMFNLFEVGEISIAFVVLSLGSKRLERFVDTDSAKKDKYVFFALKLWSFEKKAN